MARRVNPDRGTPIPWEQGALLTQHLAGPVNRDAIDFAVTSGEEWWIISAFAICIGQGLPVTRRGRLRILEGSNPIANYNCHRAIRIGLTGNYHWQADFFINPPPRLPLNSYASIPGKLYVDSRHTIQFTTEGATVNDIWQYLTIVYQKFVPD